MNGSPRIDPLQLLKCLSVLLAPDGGIKSKEEVSRLASTDVGVCLHNISSYPLKYFFKTYVILMTSTPN
ncbi:hypothetical protein J437_LFUL001530 [Ladona fulva]|uniref:Uncharacterized protein n=1 Tax=Ladona fulva TaxID=123851 RepID=A0A8K0JVT4_LADFU|nr:hypothetical protein J437_LFUL001530 [Ladona fulva]